LLTMDGVRVEEAEPWREGAETWHVLRAYFPGSIDTHCGIQDFFFGGLGVLARLKSVNIFNNNNYDCLGAANQKLPPDGRADFYLLQKFRTAQSSIVYYAFDILAHERYLTSYGRSRRLFARCIALLSGTCRSARYRESVQSRRGHCSRARLR